MGTDYDVSLCVPKYSAGLGPVGSRARVLVHEVLGRGAQASARGGARCASQVFDRGAHSDVCGTAQVLDCGAQAVVCGAAMLVQKKKNTR